MKKTIAVLPGDGIGPEITEQSIRVLETIAKKQNHTFKYIHGLIGAIAIEQTGDPFPEVTKQVCLNADAILFGAIGDPKYDNDPSIKVRPEQGLLAMRKALGLYANIRPIFTFKNLLHASPLKPEIIKGTDFIVIRELIGGVYFGKKGTSESKEYAFDTNEYTKQEVIRVTNYAFQLAQKRKKKLTVVDKANVLETSRLWRRTIQEMRKDFPDVTVEFMFVDNAAMQIIKKPTEFDIIVTENMFGDILTDEASVITGSIGMLPSASIGEKTSVFEPIHGSYPKARGKNTANPLGSILSAAMLLHYSFGLKKESQTIFKAVEKTLTKGYGTQDITSKNPLSTSSVTDKVIEQIKELA